MNDLTHGFVSIALAIVGLAILATLVSRNANTAGVFSAAGSAFGGALSAAEGPVLGGGGSLNFQQPSMYGPSY